MAKRFLPIYALITVLTINSQAFSAQFTIVPQTSAAATYTDNVNLTKDDKEDDFIITLWAGITAQLLGKTSGASLSTDIGYSFYDQNSDNNAFRLPLNFQAWTQPTKNTRINFINRFLRTEDPEGDEAVVSEEDGEILVPVDTTVRRGRDPYWTN